MQFIRCPRLRSGSALDSLEHRVDYVLLKRSILLTRTKTVTERSRGQCFGFDRAESKLSSFKEVYIGDTNQNGDRAKSRTVFWILSISEAPPNLSNSHMNILAK